MLVKKRTIPNSAILYILIFSLFIKQVIKIILFVFSLIKTQGFVCSFPKKKTKNKTVPLLFNIRIANSASNIEAWRISFLYIRRSKTNLFRMNTKFIKGSIVPNIYI